MSTPTRHLIPIIQRHLHEHFGPRRWWPADSPFEVAVGAILTQNTAWTNVERAIQNLQQAQALSAEKLATLPLAQLEVLIRPAGFFRQKAVRLQNLARHLVDEWQNDLAAFCGGPLDEARTRLLALEGVGPETADSILLYAAGRLSFVVDAYTRRIFTRVGLLQGAEKYAEIRQLFMQNLPEDVQLYNEYHAQIVQLAKVYCRKNRTLCTECPIAGVCRYAKQAGTHDSKTASR